MRRAVVESVGHYLPNRVVENSEFEATLDTNDAWIRSRTGIERRHFAAENETSSDMGIKAAQAALANASCTVDDVDAISRRPLVRGFPDNREEVLGLVRDNLRRFTNSPGRHRYQWNLLGSRIVGTAFVEVRHGRRSFHVWRRTATSARG